ncbi:MAG: STAS domain-containing protein [Planctomycetota bacterium]|nr:STAS domain-containing protein [Planctomycetota bacterium]
MSRLDVTTVDGVTVATVNQARMTLDDDIHSLSRELKLQLSRSESRKILLNLEHVVVMASMMIGELVMLKKHFEANDSLLRLCGLSPTVVESLQISGICDLFEIDNTEEVGLANFRS